MSGGSFPAAGPRAAEPVEDLTRTYSGTRQSDGTTFVNVNGRPLETRTELRKEAATTFDWGYQGRGAPAQLALAILADHLGDDGKAMRYYEHFLRCVIRGLPRLNWILTGAEIDGVLPAGGY